MQKVLNLSEDFSLLDTEENRAAAESGRTRIRELKDCLGVLQLTLKEYPWVASCLSKDLEKLSLMTLAVRSRASELILRSQHTRKL